MATAVSYWLYIHTGQRDSMPYAAAQKADLTIRQPRWTLFDGQGDIAHATSDDGLHWTYDRIVLDESFKLFDPITHGYNICG